MLIGGSLMANKFGGPWTLIKLEMLKKYLLAYAKVFKYQPYYKLIYLDAFAGSGKCDTKLGLINGSTKIALESPRFDEYIFIELDKENIENLYKLKNEYPYKKIKIIKGNCNDIIPEIIKLYDWNKTRALAFLDPYNMQLSFNTLESLAQTQAFDIWYLFPLNAATRSLRNNGKLPKKTEDRLNNLFGDNDWKSKLYYIDSQISLFDNDINYIRKDQDSICCYFKEKMQEIFPSVLCPVCLKNKNNAPLFLLYFAVANHSRKAQNAANRIASYLINKERTFVCNNPKKMI